MTILNKLCVIQFVDFCSIKCVKRPREVRSMMLQQASVYPFSQSSIGAVRGAELCTVDVM